MKLKLIPIFIATFALLSGCNATQTYSHAYYPDKNEKFTFGTTPCMQELQEKVAKDLQSDVYTVVDSDESIMIDPGKKTAYVKCSVTVTP